MLPDFKIKSSTKNPIQITQNPALIEKNAIDKRNNVGLPVFLNPISDITPIPNPTKNPIKFRIFSSKNSTISLSLKTNYFNLMNDFTYLLIPFI